MIEANNPNLITWLDVTQNSDFPIQNIPFGIALINKSKLVVSRIGDTIINLSKLYELGVFHDVLSENYFDKDFLNDFLKKKKSDWRSVRNKISEIFTDENNKDKYSSALYDLKDVEMCMPVKIGDYTDFYSSRQHAYNVGCMFRDPDNAYYQIGYIYQ